MPEALRPRGSSGRSPGAGFAVISAVLTMEDYGSAGRGWYPLAPAHRQFRPTRRYYLAIPPVASVAGCEARSGGSLRFLGLAVTSVRVCGSRRGHL